MFQETIDYEVPEFESLKEKFKTAAEISEDGRIVKMGDLTAQNGLLDRFMAVMAFHQPRSAWSIYSINKNDALHETSLLKTNRDNVIELMAKHEARKHLSEGAKEQALVKALEEKAREIRSKNITIG